MKWQKIGRHWPMQSIAMYALLGLPFVIDERGAVWGMNIPRPIPPDSPALASQDVALPPLRIGLARALPTFA